MRFFLICLLLPYTLLANAASYIEGVDYQVLNNSTKMHSAQSKVTVMEFFSYGCPWCYQLEGTVKAIESELPKGATFERTPVVFEKNWDLYAKAYYAARALNDETKLSGAIFNAIQKENKPLDTTKAMIAFFISQGVSKTKANSAFLHSPTLNIQVNNAIALMQKYRVYSVPSFVVNGQYKTDLAMAKGNADKLKAVTLYLVGLAQGKKAS